MKANSQSNIIQSFQNDNYKLSNPIKYYTQSLFYELTGKIPRSKVFQWIKKYLKEDCKVMELGLNPGTITIDLVRMGINVLGIDSSPKKIVFAQHINHIELEIYQIFKNHISFDFPFEDFISSKFKLMNLNNLDLEANSIDIIFSDGGLNSLDLSEVLTEAKRILKNNGILIFRLNLNNNLSWTTNKEATKKITPKKLKDWALLNNFHILHSNYMKISCTNNLKTFLTSFVDKQNILFVAEKRR